MQTHNVRYCVKAVKWPSDDFEKKMEASAPERYMQEKRK